MGKQALERVQEVAATRHGCCWEPHEGPHHPVCSKFVALEVPEIHEAQESLL